MTASLGFTEPDKLEETLATVMANIINAVEMEDDYGILRHEEGIELMPGNIELSGLEVSRVCQVKCVSSFLHLFPQPSAV